ncbi:MAG TPA: CHASE3 domain-containing protein [Leptolyngbyaceae cyanobacterium]
MLEQLSKTLFRRRLIYAVTLPVVLLLLLAGISIFQITRLLTALQWIDHTNRVISHANYVQKLLLDMETGLRGYQLTGEPEFLEPYEQANAIAGNAFDELEQLVSDNPSQTQHANQIQSSYEDWIRLVSPAITRRQQGQSEPLSLTRLRKQEMDLLRKQISAFITTEEHLRVQRSRRAQVTTKTVIVSSLILAFGVGSILAYFIRRLVLDVSRSYEAALASAKTEAQVAKLSAQRLEALHQIDRSILAAQSDKDLVRNALTHLKQLVPSQQVFVALFDQSSQSAQILVSSVEGNLYLSEGTTFPLQDYVPLEVLEQQQARYIKDLAAFEQRPPIYNRLLTEGIQSCLSLPLQSQGNLVGDLTLTAAVPCAFNSEARAIAQEVAAQLAIALEQSKLRGQLQSYTIQLEQRVEERTIRLQEINEELEAFTYSVSHDLRAPLRTVQGFAQALLEDYGDQLDGLGKSYIQSIIDDSVQMDTLISDLLSYSRLTRREISLQPVNLTAIVQEALHQLETQIQERQAEITIRGELPFVLAHYSTLVQVVVNLLSNAIKFVQQGTSPVIEVYAQEEMQDQQAWVKLWITDNGIGVAPEHQERIFQVFERLHGNESYTGTGIGLAIVRTVIERMGGRVGVVSQPDQGSQFWIALPKAVTTTSSSHESGSSRSTH